MQQNLAVLDGYSLMYRAFYALPLLSSEEGVYTNAVYGFMNMLLRFIEDHKPTHLAVAFDMPGLTFRHGDFADYKATRKPMPDELRPQFALLKKLLSAMRIPVLESPGMEADDILGTMSRLAEKEGFEIHLVSGDRDILQLIDDSSTIFLTKRGITQIEAYDKGRLKEEMDLVPSQITDLKGLMGDASDNIPGIKGVGEKTALKLLAEYGTVENIISNAGKLTGKLKELIENGADQALMSKKLATIKTDIELGVSLEDCRITPIEQTDALSVMKELKFGNLLKRLSPAPGKAEMLEAAVDIEMITVDSVDKIGVAIQALTGDKAVAIAMAKDSIRISAGATEYMIPLAVDLLGRGLELEEAMKALRPFFESPIPKVLFDAKFWIRKCRQYCIDINNIEADLMIAANLLNRKSGTLSDVLGLNESSLAAASPMIDSYIQMKDELSRQKQDVLFHDIEMPLVEVIADIEEIGFKVDTGVLKEIGKDLDNELSRLTESIYGLAGMEFNINSPKQLGEVLFERLRLPSIKKTKTGWSTDSEVLDKLSEEHAIVPLIEDYRQLAKLKGTYIDGMLPLVDRQGRIHTKLHQVGTSTGRLSSSDPNLQNIPVRTPEGRLIRKAFVATDDEHTLVDADYSQIELRVLAHMAHDANMLDAFIDGADIHRRTASQVFGVPFDDVTPEMRSSSKAVNFGIVYGISDFGLARQLGIPRRQAGEFIDKYFATFPGVKEFMNVQVEFAKQHGYVKTMYERRCYLPTINSSNYAQRSGAARVAMNAPIQGTAADIIKMAMVAVHRRLKEEGLGARLILQVHDELLIDTPKNETEVVKKLLVEEMQQVAKLDCPLIAEAASGASWFEAK